MNTQQILEHIDAIATKSLDIFAEYDSSKILIEENKKEIDSLVNENITIKNLTTTLSEQISNQRNQIMNYESIVANLMDDKSVLLTIKAAMNDLKYEVRM